MLRRLRETAPAGLVPLAWGFAAAAHVGALAPRSVLIGHGVMTALLVAFAGLSYDDMRAHPVLRAWLAVIVAGVPVTLVGAYGVRTGDATAAAVAVGGWAALPAAALWYTGRVLPADERARAYTAGGLCSGLGAALFGYAVVAAPVLVVLALALVGAGQTLGILTATVTY
jgi:hypothetical protein